MTTVDPVLYTIGHSNHDQEHFCSLLQRHRIEVLADVRSQPYSRHAPQFNAEALKAALASRGIRYLFLGDQLGGRPRDPAHYDEQGYALYHQMARSEPFLQGIERLSGGMKKYRVAIMCGEEDPAVCHRFLLVSRVMADRGTEVQHIRGDGSLASHEQIGAATGGQRPQSLLFPKMEDDSWKSLRSVLPKAAPPNSRKTEACRHSQADGRPAEQPLAAGRVCQTGRS
ncbi:MAG: DUF488 domain-containing protein, partial [Pirellulaceae bacterium]